MSTTTPTTTLPNGHVFDGDGNEITATVALKAETVDGVPSIIAQPKDFYIRTVPGSTDADINCADDVAVALPLSVLQKIAATPVVGSRWRLKHDVERYPHFTAPINATGIVTDTYDNHVSLKLDEPVVGAEEWDNELVWSDDLLLSFTDDCESLEGSWLIEWDGGWMTAPSETEAWATVDGIIVGWAGEGTRDEFAVRPNVPDEDKG